MMSVDLNKVVYNSSDLYKLYNNDQLDMPQQSKLGVNLGNDLVISAVGQADDTAVVANSIHNINCLLKLSLAFCRKYHVSLSPGKTKLQVMYTRDMKKKVDYEFSSFY